MNRIFRTRCDICSKSTIKTPERCQWCRSGVFIVKFKHFRPCSSVSIVNFEQLDTGRDLVEVGYSNSFPGHQVSERKNSGYISNKLLVTLILCQASQFSTKFMRFIYRCSQSAFTFSS